MEALPSQQRLQYERDGYLFPFKVLDADEVAYFRAQYERLAQLVDRHRGREHGQTHLHFPWAYDLATRPAVLDLVEGLIGPDILVHTSTMFWKDPRDPRFVSWHQDAHYLGLDAPRMVTAWVALSDSTTENGCMRVIPGTHKTRLAHNTRRSGENLVTSGLQVDGQIDDSEAVDLVLPAGQISLHHADLLHGSGPNGSDAQRVGFVVRYLSADVRQQRPHHAVVLARGRDTTRHYELLEQPPVAEFDDALASHLAFWEQLRDRAERGEATFGPAS